MNSNVDIIKFPCGLGKGAKNRMTIDVKEERKKSKPLRAFKIIPKGNKICIFMGKSTAMAKEYSSSEIAEEAMKYIITSLLQPAFTFDDGGLILEEPEESLRDTIIELADQFTIKIYDGWYDVYDDYEHFISIKTDGYSTVLHSIIEGLDEADDDTLKEIIKRKQDQMEYGYDEFDDELIFN